MYNAHHFHLIFTGRWNVYKIIQPQMDRTKKQRKQTVAHRPYAATRMQQQGEDEVRKFNRNTAQEEKNGE